MYKLLAVDMDGTLLREDKSISKMTLKAVQEARKKGIQVVLSSGRHLTGITDYLKKLNLLHDGEYAVTMNGCAIQEVTSQRYIYKKLLTSYDIDRIITLGRKLNADLDLVTPGCFYIEKYKDIFKFDAGINKVDLKIINYDSIPQDLDICKVMFVNDTEFIDKVIHLIPDDYRRDYTVIRSGPNFLEFINKDANKGTAVAHLTKMFEIDPNQVICIGDADNDRHMIKYAGLGVAMGNALPTVKKIADYITKTNEEDGVAYVINKFILGGKAI